MQRPGEAGGRGEERISYISAYNELEQCYREVCTFLLIAQSLTKRGQVLPPGECTNFRRSSRGMRNLLIRIEETSEAHKEEGKESA